MEEEGLGLHGGVGQLFVGFFRKGVFVGGVGSDGGLLTCSCCHCCS